MKKTLLAVIGFGIFAFILINLDLNRLFSILIEANSQLVLIAVLLSFIGVFFRALKWKVIVKNLGCSLPVWKAVKYYLIGIAFGLITPGRAGDFIKTFYLNKKMNSLSKSFSSVVLERLIDISILMLAGIASISFFNVIFKTEIISFASIALLLTAFVAGLYLFFNKKLLKKIMKPFFELMTPAKHKEKFREGFHKFFDHVDEISKKKSQMVLAVALGMVSWLFFVAAGWQLAAAIGINIPFQFFIFIIPIITLIDLLPISISGIGTRDAALILLFGTFGFGLEKAVAFSFLYLIMMYWLVALIGFILFSTEKIDFK